MNHELALKRADYESEVGDFLGYGRGTTGGDDAWPSITQNKIEFDVRSALRRFYFCGHPWSFLKPFATLTLKEGRSSILVPEGFGGVDASARITVKDADDNYIGELAFDSPGKVQQWSAAGSGTTGIPSIAAMRPLKSMPSQGMQQSEIFVFPEADRDYTLTFPYYFAPTFLTDETPYVYGGIEHHECVLEHCLGVAELRRDNMSGVHSIEAPRLLQISIAMDRRRQPQRLGYNGDNSDGIEEDYFNGRGWNRGGGVTINGTLFT